MIGIGKYLNAVGSPNVAAKSPAARGMRSAFKDTFAPKQRPIRRGSPAGMNAGRSTPIAMRGTGYDNPAVHRTKSASTIHAKIGPRPTTQGLNSKMSDYRRPKMVGRN